ncbi:hypothetical protein TSAR_010704, partial [Trichomalopsis sarcophagae]
MGKKKSHHRDYSSDDRDPASSDEGRRKRTRKHKKKSRRRRRHDSTSSDYSSRDRGINNTLLSILFVTTEKRSRRCSRSKSPRHRYSQSRSQSRSVRSSNATLPSPPTPPAPPEKEPTEKELTSKVLDIIGKRIEEEKALAPPVHKDFAFRWAEIMKLGLSSEERIELCKKYPPPKNCEFFNPPKLNAEVHRAINDNVRTRDKRITDKQRKLVASLSIIAKVISFLLERERTEDIQAIEAL